MTLATAPDSTAPDSTTPDAAAADAAPDDAAVAWAGDPYGVALAQGHGPLFLRRTDGGRLRLDVERWCAGPDAADRSVLSRCTGTVLDVGCGPGRMVSALARTERPALGIDTAPAAVARTRDDGGAALLRSVFDELPGEGWWGSVLLMDGNVGIGGDPEALLRRIRRLVTPGGLLLVEADAADVDERFEVRLDDGTTTAGPPFPWARVGQEALHAHALRTGWTPAGRWTVQDRTFLALHA